MVCDRTNGHRFNTIHEVYFYFWLHALIRRTLRRLIGSRSERKLLLCSFLIEKLIRFSDGSSKDLISNYTRRGFYSQCVCWLSLLLCFAVRTFEGFIGISRNLLGCRSYESSRVDSPQRLLLKGSNQSTFTLAMFLRTLIFGSECPRFFSR